jgi:hypothetical protein
MTTPTSSGVPTPQEVNFDHPGHGGWVLIACEDETGRPVEPSDPDAAMAVFHADDGTEAVYVAPFPPGRWPCTKIGPKGGTP